jgi:hypothetical protein
MYAAFFDQMKKEAGLGAKVLQKLHAAEDPIELAGLGALAIPSIDEIQARVRGGDKYKGKLLLPESTHAPAEVAGLGILAAPTLAKQRLRALGLLKHSGIVGSLKQLAMTEVPGTKPWLLGNVQKARQFTEKGVSKLPTRAATKRTAGGAYDVSHMARAMGMT